MNLHLFLSIMLSAGAIVSMSQSDDDQVFVVYPKVVECDFDVSQICSQNIGIVSLDGQFHNTIETGQIQERSIRGSRHGLFTYSTHSGSSVFVSDVYGESIFKVPMSDEFIINGNWSPSSKNFVLFSLGDEDHRLHQVSMDSENEFDITTPTVQEFLPIADWIDENILLVSDNNLVEMSSSGEITIIHEATSGISFPQASNNQRYVSYYVPEEDLFNVVRKITGELLHSGEGFPYGWTTNDDLLLGVKSTSNSSNSSLALFQMDQGILEIIETSEDYAFVSLSPDGDRILYVDVVNGLHAIPCVVEVASFDTKCFDEVIAHPNGRPAFVTLEAKHTAFGSKHD